METVEMNEEVVSSAVVESDGTHDDNTKVEQLKTGQKQVDFFPVFPILMGHVALDLPVAEMSKDMIALAGSRVNYEGGFTTYFSKENLDGRVGIDDLKDAIFNVAMVYADQAKWEVKREEINIELWGSVIHKDGFHGPHRHARSHLSGTFYAQVPNNASPIVMLNPTTALRMNEPFILPKDYMEFSAPELPIPPKVNDMFVWPAWLEHFVNTSHGKAEDVRVAYSFNVVYQTVR
jgi:uncharacterized protein (TIGR02466 family)